MRIWLGIKTQPFIRGRGTLFVFREEIFSNLNFMKKSELKIPFRHKGTHNPQMAILMRNENRWQRCISHLPGIENNTRQYHFFQRNTPMLETADKLVFVVIELSCVDKIVIFFSEDIVLLS